MSDPDIKLVHLEESHARQVAHLHVHGIPSSFISFLGVDFVTELYRAIAISDYGFGIVAQDRCDILGFVAFTSDLSMLYVSVLRTGGLPLVGQLVANLTSLRVLKGIFENMLYPVRTRLRELPETELLSIVTAPDMRQKGLGTQLVKRGLQRCSDKNIDRIKVLVGADNPANALYRKCGFQLTDKVTSHGKNSNIYVTEIGFSC